MNESLMSFVSFLMLLTAKGIAINLTPLKSLCVVTASWSYQCLQ